MIEFIELKDDIGRLILINVANIVSVAPLHDGASSVWLSDGRMIVAGMPYEILTAKLGNE